MKTAPSTLIFLSLFSTSIFANGFESQHRVGIGYASTENPNWLQYAGSDWGDGLRIEYGYEFNHVFGINLSYSTNTDSQKPRDISSEIDGYNLKFDTDIGQKFDLNGYAIKPYGILGLARQREKNILASDNNKRRESFNDISFIVGAGIRADIGNHIYSDFRFDFSNYDNTDYSTVSWSFGYRF
ncbi:porin family protein [Thaumasiovibrio sp. DFM-14]|uniref:porin family protein n=1 Tax=Thaumasiovibrio sp. DFM-14 TaxID=3384792 RepID=UPI0039A2ECDC